MSLSTFGLGLLDHFDLCISLETVDGVSTWNIQSQEKDVGNRHPMAMAPGRHGATPHVILKLCRSTAEAQTLQIYASTPSEAAVAESSPRQPSESKPGANIRRPALSLPKYMMYIRP